MTVLALKVETAIKNRVSKSPLGRSTIKAGEKCLVIQDYQGWKTNIKKSHAKKLLNNCLKQLDAQKTIEPKKEKSMLTPKLFQIDTDAQKTIEPEKEKSMLTPKLFQIDTFKLKPYQLTVSPKVQVGLFAASAFLLYKLYKKVKTAKSPEMILSNGERINSNGSTETKNQKSESVVVAQS